jgi:hypothetical protein
LASTGDHRHIVSDLGEAARQGHGTGIVAEATDCNQTNTHRGAMLAAFAYGEGLSLPPANSALPAGRRGLRCRRIALPSGTA